MNGSIDVQAKDQVNLQVIIHRTMIDIYDHGLASKKCLLQASYWDMKTGYLY